MASTYVNDLRLNEMATGDGSGTWGTTTNTNLELIAEAFSYGTEAITTNADTHTTTIADGATDPGRSIFLKYTGTLDSTCTITIGPNTVSKLWVIENATSGSQSIIIKQGTGATVTISTGKTKMIYSDGAGGGGKMVDALSSLNLETSGIIETSASIQTPLIEYTDGDDAITIADGGGLTFASTTQTNGTVTVGVDDTGYDVKFFGATSGSHMLWDESADDLKLVGAAGLTVAGDADIDGTTNLDAVDIDGSVQIDGTITVGVDDTGYDVKFFGDTASAYMLWDTSADDLILGGAARVVVPDSGLVLGSTAVTSTAAELNYVDGVTSAIQTQIDTKTSTGKAIVMSMVFG